MLRIIPTNSSQLSGIAHQPGDGFFYAKFNNGEVYMYECGDNTVYAIAGILFAESQGKAFNAFKAKGYPYQKLDPEEVAELELHV